MDTKIVAKVTSLETVIDKKNKGATSGEWQIIGDNIIAGKEITDILPITSVHTALINKEDVPIDYCFERDDLFDETVSKDRTRLDEAFDLAEHFGDIQNMQIKVVVHLHDELEVIPPSVIEGIGYILDTHPHCDMAIENSLLYHTNGEICTAANAPSVTSFVNRVKPFLKPELRPRLGNVLDVCHALGTTRLKKLISYYAGFFIDYDDIDELKKYFIEQTDTCKILHLNNSDGLGMIPFSHGTAFDSKEDQKLFDIVMDFYYEYIPQADVVVEVREDSYSDAVNFASVAKQIKEYDSRH